MKPKALVTILSMALAACAVTPDGRLSWDTKPVLDIRHGMASADAYFQLGRSQQRLGNGSAAETLYEQALAINPEHVDALNALGTLHAERGNLERAVVFFRKVANLEPQRAYLHNNVGYALYLQGRYGEAVEAFRQAVTLKPDYDRAWVNLLQAARKGGMPEVAALAARRSLASHGTAAADGAKAYSVPPAAIVKESSVAVRSRPITMDEVPPRLAAADNPGRPAAVPAVSVTQGPKAAPSPAAPAQALPAPTPDTNAPSPVPKARIEVSNGNGINGLAGRVRSQLRDDGVKVVRMTNYTTFRLRQTVIEYRDGFHTAAQSLKEQLGRPATLAASTASRPGTDVRLILGRDWTPRQSVISAELALPLSSGGFSSQDEA